MTRPIISAPSQAKPVQKRLRVEQADRIQSNSIVLIRTAHHAFRMFQLLGLAEAAEENFRTQLVVRTNNRHPTSFLSVSFLLFGC